MAEHLRSVLQPVLILAFIFFGARAALLSHLAAINKKPSRSFAERYSPFSLFRPDAYTEKGDAYRRKCLFSTFLTLLAGFAWKFLFQQPS